MKVFTTVSVIIFALFPFPQATSHPTPRHAPSAPLQKVSLELGSVTVWIGMPATEALQQFQNAGYQVLGHTSEESKLIKNGTELYTVWFKNAMLIYAERDWYSSDTDEMDAVLRALAALVSHGAEACSISHDPISKPDESADRIFINCDQRSVLLAKGKYSLSEKTSSFVSVAERIGETP